MSMFCFQCEEASKGTACTTKGICGKTDSIAVQHDLLVYLLKGLAVVAEAAQQQGRPDATVGPFIARALFATITNANFDAARLDALIQDAIARRDALKVAIGYSSDQAMVNWNGPTAAYAAKGAEVGVLAEPDADLRSLKELLVYGIKGMAAYTDHAAILGMERPEIYAFMIRALAATTRKLGVPELTALVMECGAVGVTAMALLDEANTRAYGDPEITQVKLGVGKRPGILISGHDLKDLQELLEQSADSGVDIYTHSEMLPAHAYPAFKQYPHFIGNYGGAWWRQDKEFAAFNGPILMTTNCITPVKAAYRARIYTTGMTGWPGITHIPDRPAGGAKDFSALIAQAKTCAPPTALEHGEITTGFAHAQVTALAEPVIDAVKRGAIKRFIVMGGCDGRDRQRSYYTDVAQALPEDTVILTAGCAKYRFNKLDLGDIDGIPRLLDAGQCNDAYSLAVIALKLKEAFGLDDINELPISYDIAWYEQKAIIVLLALLHLGVKHIRLGPTLPAFLSPNVAKVLVEQFDIKPIDDVQQDIAAMMAAA